MAKYAVLMRYEVTTGLVIDADSEDEANEIAQQFEEQVHDAATDTDGVSVTARIWGGGTVDIEVAVDEDDASDLIDEWIDEIESEYGFEDTDEDEDEDELDDDEADSDEEDPAVK